MMTAIALWILGGGGLALYAGWAATAVAGGASPWRYAAGLPLLYLAVLCAITLGWFALAWIFRSPRPPDLRIGFAATVRLVLDEMRAIGRSGPRMAFYRWLMPEPAPAPAAAPVLLLHGVLCNAGAMYGLRGDLVARKLGPVYALSYGPPLASIDGFADQVAAKIDAILGATGAARVAIVGHSMGGLVARAYLRRYGAAQGVAGDDARHAAPRQRARLAHSRASRSRSCGPATRGSPELNRAEGAPAGVRSCRCGRGTTRWWRRRRGRVLARAENIELVGHRPQRAPRRSPRARVAAEIGARHGIRSASAPPRPP